MPPSLEPRQEKAPCRHLLVLYLTITYHRYSVHATIIIINQPVVNTFHMTLHVDPTP